MKRKILFHLLLLLSPLGISSAQGLATLLTKADMVVEARLPEKSDPPASIVTIPVKRVLKGPTRLSKVRLFLPERISAHVRPRPGVWTLLFLNPLPRANRTWMVRQTPLAAIGADEPHGPAMWAHVERLARLRGDEKALAQLLFHTLSAPEKSLVASAAWDLVGLPHLLTLAPKGGGERLLASLKNAPPPSQAAGALVHLLADFRPSGWEDALLKSLARPKGERLARRIGMILGKRLGPDASTLLAGQISRETKPSFILALGATRQAEALPMLRTLLESKKSWMWASRALAFHGTGAACDQLERALDNCANGDKNENRQQARVLLLALGETLHPKGGKILDQVRRGKKGARLQKMASRRKR